ncbi:hypothetical protein DPMN_037425 [Dreissena polymorpha]|uniref:Uncharacterized protein n=1 Tax=Dreissena polymorpha TaxID=45954 RepID=A0A9D4RP48_DREPO|nr:hypothetical protein DPMN_037425 [Dreissena polymorpha]
MSIDCTPCQDGRRRPGLAVHTSREILVCCRRRLHTTDPTGNTYPTHRLNLQGKTLSHRLILTSQANTLILLEILTSGHLSSWQYLPQGTRLHTSADRVAREHGHPIRHLRPSHWLHIMQHGPVT